MVTPQTSGRLENSGKCESGERLGEWRAETWGYFEQGAAEAGVAVDNLRGVLVLHFTLLVANKAQAGVGGVWCREERIVRKHGSGI